jgi:hypothetical protein
LKIETIGRFQAEEIEMLKVCKHCGLPEEDHHDYEPSMPDGCVCDPNEWGDNVPAPCAEYLGDGQQHCKRCDHDRACHMPANV